jgi:hypothetical protein
MLLVKNFAERRILPNVKRDLSPALSFLWIPNLMFVNIKLMKNVKGLQDESTLFMRHNGEKGTPVEILYIQLAEITVLCPMR